MVLLKSSVALRNSRKVLPRLRASSGSFVGPKIRRATPMIMAISQNPRPNTGGSLVRNGRKVEPETALGLDFA